MSTKRFSALLLGVSMLVGILSGCGSNSGESASPAPSEAATGATASASAGASAEDPLKDPQEISFAFWEDATAFAGGEDKSTEQIKKDLNITVKPVMVTWSDYGEKFKIWASTGELPDVFAHEGLYSHDVWKWQSQGVIKPLPKDLSPYPNLKKIIDLPQSKAFLKDGQYWAIPRYGILDDKNIYTQAILVNKEIYDSLGLAKKPETMDELHAMLEGIKQKYPDKIPLTSHNLDWMFSLYNNYTSGSSWVLEDGKYIPSFFSKKTVEGIKAMKTLWDDGLLDKDFVINKNTDNGKNNFLNGKAAAIVHSAFPAHLRGYQQDWEKKNPGKPFADNVVEIFLPKGPDGNAYISQSGFWSESYFNSNVDDKKMDRILRLYDYLLSDKGTMLRRYGIEGVDYKMDGDNIVITREKDSNGAFKPIGDLYKNIPVWSYIATWDEDFPYVDPSMDPGIHRMGQDWLDYKALNVKFFPNEQTLLDVLSTPLKDKFAFNLNNEDEVKLLLSKDVDKASAEIMQKYEKAGYKEMVDEVNKAGKEAGYIK